MYLKHFTRRIIVNLSKTNGTWSPSNRSSARPSQLPSPSFIHSHRRAQSSYAVADADGDGGADEFLSRFVWRMRKKVSEEYPECDKETVNGMLRVIAEQVVAEIEGGDRAPAAEFSDDLWRAVWEVSGAVTADMKRAAKKEKMKRFLQCREVKDMTRFAVEVGVRGDMLRQMRFRWACDKMEEADFHDGLDRLRRGDEEEKDESPVSLPERRGRIGYKIYGLDLSDPKWAEAADRVREAGEAVWPNDAKPISGKNRAVGEKILCLNEGDDPAPLLAEWAELVQPGRADWVVLLNGLKEKNSLVYFKVADFLLSEESFRANICDYSNLMDAHAKADRLEDAERILKKMNEKGIAADLTTATVLVHMYCKAGNLDRTKEAYETLKSHGFQPDINIYSPMITAYVNAGKPEEGFKLTREMCSRNIIPTNEICLALLRSFCRGGDVANAESLYSTMWMSGIEVSFEAYKLLVEACSKAGLLDQARNKFDNMLKLGHRPDDESTASLIAAYEEKNLLREALSLLSNLEKIGFRLGVVTYSVVVDWLGKLQLVDEAEQLLGKISELGEAPPVRLHISLCDMYSRAGYEKKALQAFGVLEAKKDELGSVEFERIIKALVAGRFTMQSHRMLDLMEAGGFAAPEGLKSEVQALRTFGRMRPLMR